MWPEDNFYKNLYWRDYSPANGDLSEYEGWRAIGLNDASALRKVKEMYEFSPQAYSAYAGELPEVVITPDKNARNDVILTTYYPGVSKYWATGHSTLDTPGGNHVNVMSSDPGYNILLNNCSDATREALEIATRKKMNPWFFTTPGDVRSFAEDVLGGKSFDNGDGSILTFINLPLYLINEIAKYAQNLHNKRRLLIRRRAEARRNRILNTKRFKIPKIVYSYKTSGEK